MRARLARWLVRAAWVLSGVALVWLVAFSGTDAGSAILFAVAILLGGGAVVCGARAISAAGGREALLWAGRALGLLGAAVAISFPATLYQEIAMLAAQGRRATYDIERALWYEMRMMPLVVVPALLALRWPRAGGVLFLLEGAFAIFVSLARPFGVIYPEATGGGGVDLLAQTPPFVAGALLLLGTVRRPARPVDR